jgi:PBP1b-binding outer membrane lipoprotein LpoB
MRALLIAAAALGLAGCSDFMTEDEEDVDADEDEAALTVAPPEPRALA